MIKIFFIGIFMFVTLFVGCTSGKQETNMICSGGSVSNLTIGPSQVRVLDWDNREEVNFEDIIEDIQYIPLGDEEDVIGMVAQILYNDGIFYIYDEKQDEVFLYNEVGKCIKKISDRGSGPKEYIGIGNIDINPECNELLIEDSQSSNVSFYDLKGNFKYKRKLPVQNGQTYSLGDSTLFVQMEAFQNRGSDEIEGYGCLVMKGDSVYRKGFKYITSQIGFCGTNGVVDSYDNQSLYYKPLFSDSIYHIDSDSVCSLAYYFKDEESVWNKHWQSNEFVNMMDAKGTSIIDVYDLKDELLVLVSDRTEKKMKVMIYDKHNDKTYCMNYDRAENVNRIHHMWGLDPFGTYKGEYITCVFGSGYIEEMMKERVKKGELEIINPELKDIVMDIDSDSNPVLVLVKFKLPGQ